jgi:hypothetical protein
MPLKMSNLENCFKRAKELNEKYAAVRIQMVGFPKDEIIINGFENIDTKLEYYQKTYDEELNHRFAKGIKIVGFTFGSSFEQIEEDFEIKFT